MREDDVRLEDLDPVEDSATPLHRRSVNILKSRLSVETPPSSGTPRVSSSMERREKRKERDLMASILESLSTMMAESQQKHNLQMAELSADRSGRACRTSGCTRSLGRFRWTMHRS